MPTLGDSFPEDKKREYIINNLRPGQIIYLFCDFTNPPKEKYIILVCTEPKLLFFLINSEIHPYIKKRVELNHCQVSINQSDHNFLSHDSFIDCTDVKDLRLEDVETQVLADMSRIKGMTNQHVIDDIKAAVKTAKTIIPRYKKWILDSLSDFGKGL